MLVLTVGNRYPPAGFGGYERIWVECVGALRAAGHDVRVLTTADQLRAQPSSERGQAPSARSLPAQPGGERGLAPFATSLPAQPVWRELEWYWSPDGWRALGAAEALALERRNARRLADALAGVDVVCWWGMGGMSLSLIEQVRRAGVPACGVVGDGWMLYGFDADAWMRRSHRRPGRAWLRERRAGVPCRVDLSGAAEWLFISEAARARSPRLARTALAHPGVDPQRFPFAAPGPWRARLLVAGRIEEPKGVDVAIRALALLPDATLTVDGRGPDDYVASLRALAASLGVAERVAFQESTDMGAVYAAHDCVLFPVRWQEPWGLVPLEAMAVGRPVLACVGGGTGEYFEHGANGLAVERESPERLATAVQRLAGSAELRGTLVSGGRATAARFTRAAFEAAVVAACERAARASSAPAQPVASCDVERRH